MKRSNRALWVILLGLPALLVLPAVIVGSTVVTHGTIEVQVHEKHAGGTNIGLTIPAGIVPIACHLLPNVVIDDVRLEMDDEARRALKMADALMEELANTPDGIYVDIIDGTDMVTIEKRDGKLEIFVDTPAEMVKISVPVRTVSTALGALAT